MREATAKARLRASFALYRLAQHPANKYGLIAAGAVPAAKRRTGMTVATGLVPSDGCPHSGRIGLPGWSHFPTLLILCTEKTTLHAQTVL